MIHFATMQFSHLLSIPFFFFFNALYNIVGKKKKQSWNSTNVVYVFEVYHTNYFTSEISF